MQPLHKLHVPTSDVSKNIPRDQPVQWDDSKGRGSSGIIMKPPGCVMDRTLHSIITLSINWSATFFLATRTDLRSLGQWDGLYMLVVEFDQNLQLFDDFGG